MELEQQYDHKKNQKKIRLKIVTNRNLQFITSVKTDATISDLANRSLSAYLELSEQLNTTAKKQLTVSAVKQGVFYMPKSELVSNLLKADDQVEVVIIKAKPKYPNQLFPAEVTTKKKKVPCPQPIKIIPENDDKKVQIAIKSLQKESIHEQKLQQSEQLCVQVEEQLKKKSKKERKKQKMQKKKLQQTSVKELKKDIHKKPGQKEFKHTESKELLQESLPSKKIKVEKEESIRSPDKILQKVMPSPKITFHPEPKIDSPKISLTGQGVNRITTSQVLSNKVDIQLKKGKLESDKTVIRKVVSPLPVYKSPPSILKTPLQQSQQHQLHQQIQKQELSNFQLSRKGSEDRRSEVKSRKNGQENAVQWKKAIIRDSVESNINSIKPMTTNTVNNRDNPKEAEKAMISQSTVVEKQETKGVPSILIVQPDSESGSEQNKRTNISHNSTHRSRQMAEIKSKIKSYMIDSSDQE